LHELQAQVTQAALSNDPTKWNPEAAMQAAASVGNTAPELAPDVMGWAREQSAKFNPPPKIGRGAPGSVAYDERTGLPIPGSQIPEKPAAPTAASLATAAAAGDEKAKAALDLLQNREHSTTNVDLAVRAVNGDPKAAQALKLLRPPSETSTAPVAVMGPEGKPVYVTREQALGQQPATGMTARPPTGEERKTLAFFNRAREAVETLTTAPEGQSSLEQRIAGQSTVGQYRGKYAPNILQTEDQQRYTQAQRAFTEARLRKESGAAIPEHEYENDRRTYFAQPGDGAAVVAQKQRARATVLAGLKAGAGKAYEEYYGEPNLSPVKQEAKTTPTSALDAEWEKLPKPPATAPAGALTREQSQFLLKHPEYVGQWPPQPNEQPKAPPTSSSVRPMSSHGAGNPRLPKF
jgi:hypothetical protein